MSKGWYKKNAPNEQKTSFVAWVQTYFKHPQHSRETRPFADILRAIAVDLKDKFGVEKAKEILRQQIGEYKEA